LGVPNRPANPLLKAVGRRVRTLRKRQKWSQETFADEAGIDRSYASGIERGVRNVSVLTLFKIARALKMPITSLFQND
jgi:transcriptional regulator with XRE-family HTH domain